MRKNLDRSLKAELSVRIIRAGRAIHRSRLVRSALGTTHARQLPLINRLYRAVYLMGRPKNATTVEARVHGLRIAGPMWDNTILPALVAGYYEEFELTLFRRVAEKSRGVIDMGANIGLYTCIAAAATPDTRVLAFEPVPENFRFLLTNIETNGLAGKVLADMQAVGECRGELTLHLSSYQIGTHSASPANMESFSHTTTVPLIDLDTYLKSCDMPPVDLIKIDIEGYDGFALRGAVNTVREYRPTIFAEFHTRSLSNCGFSPEEFLDLLTTHGHRLFVIDFLDNRLIECRPDNIVETIDSDPVSRIYRSNVLAVCRPDHLAALSEWLPSGKAPSR